MSSVVRADVRNALARYNVRNCRVLIAVSGGVDSITLLDSVAAHAEEMALEVHVAHVDHALREDSALDALAVQAEAGRRKLRFYTVRVDVRLRAHETGSGIEAAARSLRYEFLASTAEAIGATVVMTGHTSDDAVETVLMNIARAGSLHALSGIPAERSLSDSVRVIRPLLEVRRQDVISYAHEHGLCWTEDASNSDPSFLRNRVRHELLPVLTSVFGHGIRRNILRLGSTMKELAEIINMHPGIQTILQHTGGGIKISLPEITEQPRVIVDAALRKELVVNSIDRDRIYDLVSADVGSRATLSGGRQALRERDHIMVQVMADAEPPTVEFEVDITSEATITPFRLADAWLHVRPVDACAYAPPGVPERAVGIDIDAIRGSVRCRPWQHGDRLRLRGMQGSKLVSDVLTDAKIPHARRSQVYVLADDDGILWICGLRQADRAVAGDGTIRYLLCWVSDDASR